MKILGIDDSVDTCDCCGKAGLLRTVAVEVNGEILHYGCVCASRHTGMSSTQIATAAKKAHEEKIAAASAQYKKHVAYLALEVRQSSARKQGLVGKAFKEFCNSEIEAARVAHREIGRTFGVQHF